MYFQSVTKDASKRAFREFFLGKKNRKRFLCKDYEEVASCLFVTMSIGDVNRVHKIENKHSIY